MHTLVCMDTLVAGLVWEGQVAPAGVGGWRGTVRNKENDLDVSGMQLLCVSPYYPKCGTRALVVYQVILGGV